MEIYLAQQTIAFLWSLALGAVLGMLYDVFRITRLAVPTAAGIVAVEDIFFFVIGGVSTFLFLMGHAEGKLRVFLLLGEFLGGILYFCTLSRLIMAASRWIIGLVHGLFRLIFRFLLYPIWRLLYGIVRLFLRPVRFLIQIVKKVVQRCKLGLKQRIVLLYNYIKVHWRHKKKKPAPEKGPSDGSET